MSLNQLWFPISLGKKTEQVFLKVALQGSSILSGR